MKHLTAEDLAQVARVAEYYCKWYGADVRDFPGSSQLTIEASEIVAISQAFLQLYSDKPRRDDDPVHSDEE